MYDELIKNLRKMQSHEYCVIVSIDGFPAMQIVKQAADAIEELQKRKRGKWTFSPEQEHPVATCSLCGEHKGGKLSPFCPWCGAEMDTSQIYLSLESEGE